MTIGAKRLLYVLSSGGRSWNHGEDYRQRLRDGGRTLALEWVDNWARPRVQAINKRWQAKIEAKTKGKAEALKYETLHFSILRPGLRRRCVTRKILTFHRDTGERENQETSRPKKRKHGTE
jgi:hypothetical protein